LKQDTGRGRSN
jgi:hypothetical protein